MNTGHLPPHPATYNSQQQTTYPGSIANPTTHQSRPILSQGIQLNAMQNLPRASILQANANATYQRPVLVIISISFDTSSFYIIVENWCKNRN